MGIPSGNKPIGSSGSMQSSSDQTSLAPLSQGRPPRVLFATTASALDSSSTPASSSIGSSTASLLASSNAPASSSGPTLGKRLLDELKKIWPRS